MKTDWQKFKDEAEDMVSLVNRMKKDRLKRTGKPCFDIEFSPDWIREVGENLAIAQGLHRDFMSPRNEEEEYDKAFVPLRLEPIEIAKLAASLCPPGDHMRKNKRPVASYVPDAIHLAVFTAAMLQRLRWPLWSSASNDLFMTRKEAEAATELSEKTIVKWMGILSPEFLASEEWVDSKIRPTIPIALVREIKKSSQQSMTRRSRLGKAAQKKSEKIVDPVGTPFVTHKPG